MGVACVGVHVGEADHDVLEGELSAGQLIDGVLGGFLGGIVHLHRIGVAECGIAERGAVALGMQDGELLGGRLAREFVHLVGAVVGEVEDGALAGSVEADLGIRGGFADLLAGCLLYTSYIALVTSVTGQELTVTNSSGEEILGLTKGLLHRHFSCSSPFLRYYEMCIRDRLLAMLTNLVATRTGRLGSS